MIHINVQSSAEVCQTESSSGVLHCPRKPISSFASIGHAHSLKIHYVCSFIDGLIITDDVFVNGFKSGVLYICSVIIITLNIEC